VVPGPPHHMDACTFWVKLLCVLRAIFQCIIFSTDFKNRCYYVVVVGSDYAVCLGWLSTITIAPFESFLYWL